MFREKNKGITLVALVITIVILLILAGISISTLTNTGIFQKAKDAKKASENAEKEQRETLGEYEKELNKQTAQELTENKINTVLSKTENTVLKDKNGNVFTLPAGFKVVVNDDTGNVKTVDKGIVIEDATVDNNGNATPTSGSQFVWVPVGDIKKDDGTTTITLGRYDFDPTTGIESTYSGSYVEEDQGDNSKTLENLGNVIAKNITRFKISVSTNKGFYMGRYEARTTEERKSRDDKLTQITEKVTDQVYNYVTQIQAAGQAQNMYNNSYFISDLMNGYAWDTAITFIQKCSNRVKYSREISVNDNIFQTGTEEDKICNIFDMASNLREWTTETSYDNNNPCVITGGHYCDKNNYTGQKNGGTVLFSSSSVGFRPILYVNI